jgi:hypothetical protein
MNDYIATFLLILGICVFLGIIAIIISMIRHISSNVHVLDLDLELEQRRRSRTYLYIVVHHPTEDIALGKFEILL